MKIHKLGHCCLHITTNGVSILTDPGMFSVSQNSLTGIDAVVITHEHGDHLHIDSVKEIVKNNPNAVIVTNAAVAKKLAEADITCEVVDGRAKTVVKGVNIEAFDCPHEEIFERYGMVQNTAYFIGDELFYPGDAFFAPDRPIPILALPVAGPWCKIPDALRYAIRAKPTKAFPVHDAVIMKGFRGFLYKLTEDVLKERGVSFMPLDEEGTLEL